MRVINVIIMTSFSRIPDGRILRFLSTFRAVPHRQFRLRVERLLGIHLAIIVVDEMSGRNLVQ
jgi:hypothetical protein